MPDFILECTYPKDCLVAGVDEAGRGPWAGPVVAAAVIFPARQSISERIDDSKKLKPILREQLVELILQHGIVGVGEASVEEIDTLNIWGATSLAMRRAVKALPQQPHAALIDGKLIPKHFPFPAQAVVKGDAVSYSIAAASIIAKVTRDRIMHQLAETYPQYGFERHAGYGTKYHLDAIREHGPCPVHRTSWPLHKVWSSHSLSPRGGEGRVRGHAPIAQLRETMDDRSTRTPLMTNRARALRQQHTDAERALWAALRARQLLGIKFRRQYPIGNYIADFAAPERMLIIELDGGQHNEKQQHQHDSMRTQWLASQGWQVLRFWNHDVLKDKEGVLISIMHQLANMSTLTPSLSLTEGEGV